jgi:Bacterial PH domain
MSGSTVNGQTVNVQSLNGQSLNGMREHGSEPVRGLPEALPGGERILWQGGPTFWDLARHVLLIPHIAVYFAVLIAWNIASVLASGGGSVHALASLVWLAPLACVAMAVLGVIGWFMHRTTIYTITDRRVVLRYGLALPMAVNIPFQQIASACLTVRADGRGNIALVLGPEHRMFYLLMWPHVRPWALTNPEPMLRGVADAAAVAEILGQALSEHAATQSAAVQPAAARATRPVLGSVRTAPGRIAAI